MNHETRILESRRIKWSGHVWKAERHAVGTGQKCLSGRQRQRWIDRVREDFELLGIRGGEQLTIRAELQGEV